VFLAKGIKTVYPEFQVEDMLTYLGCASAETAKQWGPAVANLHFCMENLVAERLRRGLPRHVDPRELPDEWEASLLLPGEGKGDLAVLGHARTLSQAERRRMRAWGLPVPVLEKCARGSSIRVSNDGRVWRADHLYFLRRDRGRVKWQPLTVTPNPAGDRVEVRYSGNGWRQYAVSTFSVDAYDPELLGPFAWALRNLWSVHLTRGDSPTQVLLTDAFGVLGFFQLRDKEEGRDRRAALLHWVRAHQRQLAHDPGVEVEVRQHLRGRETFTWFGLNATVHVPPEQADLSGRP
jgi:hypothetical protein